MARATAVTPRRAPVRRAPQPRPELRTVPVKRLSARARRRRLRTVAVLGAMAFLLALLGIVTARVVLTQGQFELASVQSRTQIEEDKYHKLRLEVAQLESPARITGEAVNNLGMVAPGLVTYLTPVAIDPLTDTETASIATGSGNEWATVKRELANGKR